MAALVVTHNATIPLLALLGILFGIADAAFVPAQQAFLPRTLASDQLSSGNALLQGTMQLTGIIAPPIAGAAIAVVGTGTAFVIDSLSFFAAAAIVLMISARGVPTSRRPAVADETPTEPVNLAAATAAPAPEAPAPATSFVGQLREGIAYVLADPALRLTLLISLVMNFALGGPSAVGMPWLAEIRFDAGPVGLGLLTAGYAVGALGGTVLAGNATSQAQGRRLLATLGVSGVAMLVVALAPSMWVVFGALGVMGALIGYTNIVALSWLQRRVDPAMVGRVMAIVMLMGFGITPLSYALAGWLLDVNATAMFAGAAVIIILTTAFAAASNFPVVFDAPEPQPAAV